MRRKNTISVGVLIDLLWHPSAGGQVKTWEHFASAAESFKDNLRLTLHFQGNKKKILKTSGNVRYITLPPVLNTARFRSMRHLVDHTDISPFHFKLLSYLKDYDVIHTTDAFFAYAKTALFASRHYGIPLVNSIHTDMPEGTRLYSSQIIKKMVRNGPVNRFLINRMHLDDRFASAMKKRLRRFQDRCDWLMVSQTEDPHRVGKAPNGGRVSRLRRGIDKAVFNPAHKDRDKLEKTFGITKDRFVLIFAGRVDGGKNVMTLARAAHILLKGGEPIHVIIAGEGVLKQDIENLLGPSVTFTGFVSQETLSWLYASSDALVFPSMIEICPNVVIEAKSSGLPVLVPSKGGASTLIKRDGEDGILINNNYPPEWAKAIKVLLRDPDFSKKIGRAARRTIEAEWPSWKQVMAEDLVPVWRRVSKP